MSAVLNTDFNFSSDRIQELEAFYSRALLEDVVPFWLHYSLDRKCGGYHTYLDREGNTYGTDKAMWLQCREVWMFSRLYNALEKQPKWLEAARLGVEFISRHGFDTDGRMFFLVTREGKPLRKRRYLFTECFGIIALAEFARASGKENYLHRAKDLYRLVIDLYREPAALEPKVFPETRPMKSLAMPMILLATTQELRKFDTDPLYDEIAEETSREIVRDFLKPDERALLETVGPNGERLDLPAGRCVNPGHAVEAAWFLMREGILQRNDTLVETACRALSWSLELGWDSRHGGLFAFVDVDGRPLEQLEWDMKLWWPHTEALYASLLAHHLTHDRQYFSWFEKLHSYSFARFPDKDHGEWFGYLHRDGTIASSLKGSTWKGMFHVPRALLSVLLLLREMIAADSVGGKKAL